MNTQLKTYRLPNDLGGGLVTWDGRRSGEWPIVTTENGRKLAIQFDALTIHEPNKTEG